LSVLNIKQFIYSLIKLIKHEENYPIIIFYRLCDVRTSTNKILWLMADLKRGTVRLYPNGH